MLAQADYFLRKLDEYGSLAKVQDFIANVLPHRYHGPKVLWSFNLLRTYGKNDLECTERARLSLRRLLKFGVAFVEDLCDAPVADGTKCYWAENGVKRRKDGRIEWQSPRCKRECKRCRIDDFFVEHRAVFERFKDAIDALPDSQNSDQLRAFSQIIAAAVVDPAILLDYKNCKRLADAIIAVDSRDYQSLFSQNIRESHLLTRVLNQAFYYLPASPDRDVLFRPAAEQGVGKA